MIELHVLTPDDWAVWRELRLAALADAPHAFCARVSDWQGDGDREERWRARLGIPGSHNVVATLDGKPVGMVSGVPDPDSGRGVELISLWVDGGARGRGVGDRLVRAVERWARQEHAKVMRLAVTPDNAHAVALYRRNGFREAVRAGDVPQDERGERVMTKELGAPGEPPG
ncbi:GNAT family N-acetyltransferase [Streptomyces albus subsp. chlorinus]|uniref:GNAT family N-acetyltransferase n=1 Tax=Streptomyces albus TaxID=1888 RepID=UPI00156E8D76|nr:GNAT family N-acetyltransferase [Streptomyces albus]NSC25407.1 GNAT family N-acetyltransferase [Streptomyces albus subsp. chlorinus]